MTSFDCTVGMNVRWVDFTAILDLNSVQGSSLRGHMNQIKCTEQDRIHVYGFLTRFLISIEACT